ncbi:probable UDP-3-O-acylglucosamine N-acyltransferase 2, mitochondrial isoform X3 [Benincasa hispida]|uniref:probable UDP-3-O-acylglucosamine N-acyltransferase 2, mitochondrial isoform X3 n=1 Tax=Benincasa hispida TaxID=102211 RepID=UPI00190061BA|nr:probable UDP-3-O-acylglucosamine N-acyltransferase 2, mitochondrial isoform X3 [Benincasa hispida]
MEILVRRLASTDVARCLSTSLTRSASNFRTRFPSQIGSLCSFSHFSVTSVEGDAAVNCLGFRTWHNGGGTFHHSACIEPTAVIEVGAVVHAKSVVGASVHIGSGSVIGHAVTIGQSTKIGFNVALSNCTVGDFCVIHNGVCIGQDGFGFFVNEHGTMKKKPQMLNVKIGTNVEIGSNTCIDRGSWRDTVIGNNTKIDNLVQIGHNVIIGDCCMLCGQVGIAGSVTYIFLLLLDSDRGLCNVGRESSYP